MSVTWTINVGGRAYGPYTFEQMKAFQAEGRLAPHSLVARDGAEPVRYASEDGDLAVLFPAPGAREPQAAVPGAKSENAKPATFGRESQTTGERSRFIIIADMKSGSISALEEEIFRFGAALRFMQQSWILITDVSLNTLRSELIQKLGKIDALVVIDTSHDKAAWFNFGPESDTKMRRLWQRDTVPTAKSSA
jgi:hypothetical protein